MKIIAIDPGGTTGVAGYEDSLFYTGEVGAWETAVDYVLALEPDIVVCESFHITAQTLKVARSYDALYMIGTLKYELPKRGIELVMQTPSERQFATPKKLAAVGWKVKGDHATQATRHLLTYLFKTGRITALELSLGDC